MRTRSPSHGLLPVLGALLMVAGALLLPLGVLLGQGHKELTTEDSFVATFAPLAGDRQVQERIAELLVSELDVPSVAEQLSDWGAPPWLADPFGEVLESEIESLFIHVLETDEFATAWREALRVSHGQVLDQLAARSGDSASPLVVDTRPVLTAIRDALTAEGSPVAHFVPGVDSTIVLLPAGDMAEIRPTSTMILRAGPWLPWAPVALIGSGVLLTRARWVATSATILACTAISIRALEPALPEWLSTGSQVDPITSAAIQAFLEATFSSSQTTLTLIGVFGAGAAITAGGIRLIRRRSPPRTT